MIRRRTVARLLYRTLAVETGQTGKSFETRKAKTRARRRENFYQPAK